MDVLISLADLQLTDIASLDCCLVSGIGFLPNTIRSVVYEAVIAWR